MMEHIGIENLTDGFGARFVFWPGNPPSKKRTPDLSFYQSADYADFCRLLEKLAGGSGASHGAMISPSLYEMKMTREAGDYAIDLDGRALSSAATNRVIAELAPRLEERATQIGMIRALGDGRDTVTLEDFQWGEAVATLSTETLRRAMLESVRAGDEAMLLEAMTTYLQKEGKEPPEELKAMGIKGPTLGRTDFTMKFRGKLGHGYVRNQLFEDFADLPHVTVSQVKMDGSCKKSVLYSYTP